MLYVSSIYALGVEYRELRVVKGLAAALSVYIYISILYLMVDSIKVACSSSPRNGDGINILVNSMWYECCASVPPSHRLSVSQLNVDKRCALNLRMSQQGVCRQVSGCLPMMASMRQCT